MHNQTTTTSKTEVTTPVCFTTSDSDEPTPFPRHHVADHSTDADAAPSQSILIVDDYPMYRSGLESLVKALSPSRPTVAVGSLRAMADEIASGKRFECIFLDLELPDSQGFSTLEQALALAPAVPIYILSGHTSELLRNQCLKAGASRFIGKTIRQDELILTLQSLLTAGQIKHPEVTTSEQEDKASRRAGKKPYPVLSARQFQILVLIAEGRSNEEISSQLNIAIGTVKAHVSKLLSNLGVQNRQQAVAVLANIRQNR